MRGKALHGPDFLKRWIFSPWRRFSDTINPSHMSEKEDLVPEDVLLARMRQNAVISPAFIMMLALSAIIATLGLISNSAPTIIGAMIIAPLMLPIMSIAFAITCFEWQLLLRAFITIVVGVMLVIMIAFLAIDIIGVRIAGSEILARASPSMLDLGVALAAGCAAAYANTRPSISASVAGVAIAVALVPPLAVTGIGLALGRRAVSETGLSLSNFGLRQGGYDIASGSFVLFLTNLIGIVFVAALVFVAQRYGHGKKAFVAIAVVSFSAFFLIPPLSEALHEIYIKNRVIRLYVKQSEALAYSAEPRSKSRLETVGAFYENGILHVRIFMMSTEENRTSWQQGLEEFQADLSRDIGEPIIVEVDVIPIELLSYRAGPKPDPVPSDTTSK